MVPLSSLAFRKVMGFVHCTLSTFTYNLINMFRRKLELSLIMQILTDMHSSMLTVRFKGTAP